MRELLRAARLLGLAFALAGCVDSGTGSDFDFDGVPDRLEDVNDDFVFDPGESDFIAFDTDVDGLCDGLPGRALPCMRCEDCDNDGSYEPCLNESDPLNDDTDNDGVGDANDPDTAPGVDCAAGSPALPYGSSLPAGKPFPIRATPTPLFTSTPQVAPPTPTPAPS